MQRKKNSSSNMDYMKQKYDNAEYDSKFCFFKKHKKGYKLRKTRTIYPLIPDYDLVSNKVSTSKYTIITFLPKMLIYQFSKLANVYFLIIGLMQCITTISMSDGKPIMFLPFSVILFISALKEIFEDKKRKDQDNLENSHLVIQREGQNLSQVHSHQLHPGHVIKIMKNEQIPADVILLQSSEESGVCYIETMNLDGESNLKLRLAPIEVQLLSWENFSNIEVQYEAPNKYLYNFNGAMAYDGRFNISIKGINVLLKGSSLKNTEFVYGLVIYTGHETKIMMNSSEPAPKLSSLEKTMNKLIVILFTVQILTCFTSASINYFLTKNMNDSGQLNYLEKDQEHIQQDTILTVLISMGTWMLIFTNFIPISLLVTLEVVKFYQGYNLMREEGQGNISVQSSSLNEELGQINHIFSDKTGTLTLNRMEFKNVCVNGVNYGSNLEIPNQLYKRSSVPNQENKKKVDYVDFDDYEFFKLVESKDQKTIDLLHCIFLCHNVVVEKDHSNNPMLSDDVHYSASSPDELALISFAKLAGYIFKGSKKENGKEYYIIKHQNQIFEYEVLKFFEFNSFRKRVSIIVKNSQGQIQLYCKGADSIIEQRLSEYEFQQQNLSVSKSVTNQYANQGLRTLFLAKKDLSEQEYNQWSEKYSEAERSLQNRDEQVEKLQDSMEKDLNFLGVTAVEDKLQDEVGNTIQSIRDAGIKFWVLTGDKKETAINISHSAQIIDSDTQIIDIDDKNLQLIKQKIRYYFQSVQDNQHVKYSLIISGESFHTIETDQEVSYQFVQLSMMVQSVIGCRFTPSQKKHAVSLVKKHTKRKPTLAIGDGANDVNMILEAHVGVGVKGVEGSQASRASDFSVNEFKQLKELLFDYGRECYRKNSELVLFNFFKNLLLVLPQFWFGAILSLFSGTNLYDPWIYQLFNTIFTALPIVIYALTDREYSKRTLLSNSNFYKQGMKFELFNTQIFIKTLINGLLQSFIIIILSFYCLENTMLDQNGQQSSLSLTGMVSFTIITLYANLKIITFSNTFSFISVLGIFLSISFYILSYYIMTDATYAQNNPLWESFTIIFGNLRIVMTILLACSLLFLLDLSYQRFSHFLYDQSINSYSKIYSKLSGDFTETSSSSKEVRVELSGKSKKIDNYYKFSGSINGDQL
ncbi:phospholipid-translocating P-type ATPase, flippase family protein (macronuclear) [Tetrahymena thermophila SB210]|uniref:Phospholipid-transporting ATPase n=1 Tax=Tetrahymena thermophila (strain SB210) TaxID=312017 RepID=Q23UC9_TETTS|nr:phospholipid-translocating P-type ATPase, flippase family protein [Tetrahymena thermophila SB210]EAS00136.2 phospholipid-translocating P-type ATPase, flippase family protein [Tetrahymena thermophila SB210]|eukprot:XP_001020381.2 phospholipid-translocating P-type ATPase, flippase family protein [Tetrahymena thermophila SB210]